MSSFRAGAAPRPSLRSTASLLLVACLVVLGQSVRLAASQGDDAGLLTVERIFASGEFQPESYGPVRWLARQGGYVISAPSALPKGALPGLNDWKKTGYGGPCPPIGRHRYFFVLTALDTVLDDLAKPTRQKLERALAGHLLAKAELMGTYQKARK